jgi:hypothetical protein
MNIEELENKWNKFKKLVEYIDSSYPGSLDFIETYGERLIECPASTEQIYFGAYPGGFLDLSLNVTAKMRAMHKLFELNVPMESVVFTGLFHAIGLMGDETKNLLVPQDSDWHIKRGIMYRHNESLPKMPVSHRSLYLIQFAGIKMSLDEWTAIAISCGTHRDEAKFYAGAEPSLGLLLLHSRQWVLGRAE